MELEIGDEWTRNVVVGDESDHVVELRDLTKYMGGRKIFATRSTWRTTNVSATHTTCGKPRLYE